MEEHECLCTYSYYYWFTLIRFLPFSNSQPHFSIAVPAKMTHPPLLAKSETWPLSAVTSGWASWPCQPPRTCHLTLVPPPWRHARSPATLLVPGIRIWRTEITLTPSPSMVAAVPQPNLNVTQALASAPRPLRAEVLLRRRLFPPVILTPNTQRKKMVRNAPSGFNIIPLQLSWLQILYWQSVTKRILSEKTNLTKLNQTILSKRIF